MKKLFFIIGISLGAYAMGSAQTAATSATPAPKAACCQKGGEAKACCAKDTKAASASAGQCTGHDHKGEKAEAAPATPATPAANGSKSKGKAVKTSSL